MSVIHSVLTKLDARGAPPPAALGAMPAMTPDARAPQRLIVTALLGAAAIGFAAFGNWPAWLGQASAAQPVAPAAADASQAVIAAVATPAPETAPDTSPKAAPAAPSAPPAPRAASAAPAAAPARAAAPVPAAAAAPAGARHRDVRRIAMAATSRAAIDPAEAAVATAPASIDKRPVAPQPAQRAVLLLHRAQESAQAGQPRAALALAREALALDPALAAARVLAAVLEHETGASERAASLLREGLARTPGDSAQALLLARVQIAQGDRAGALATLERHAVRGAEADGLRGGILTQQGDAEGALRAYEGAVRQQPANSMWWLGLAIALDATGDAQRAQQAYARALAIGLPRADLTQYADRRLHGND